MDTNDLANWYRYDRAGNIDEVFTVTTADPDGTTKSYSYEGDLMATAEGQSLGYDLNGNLVESVTADLIYNWDNKLQSAIAGDDAIALKYDPAGNRLWKQSTTAPGTTRRKYIIAEVDSLAVILPELDADDNNRIVKTGGSHLTQVFPEKGKG